MTDRPRTGRRSLFAGAALLVAAALAVADTDRFSFSADRMETVLAAGRERTVLTGNAVLTSDDTEIFAERIEVYGEDLSFALSRGGVRVVQAEEGIELTSETVFYDRRDGIVRIQGDALLIDHVNEMVIEGGFLEHWEERDETSIQIGVRIMSDDLVARAQFVHYDRTEQTLSLSGLPVVTWKGDEYRATRIFVDLDEDRIVLSGAVSGQITTSDEDSAKEQTAANAQDSPEPRAPAGDATGSDANGTAREERQEDAPGADEAATAGEPGGSGWRGRRLRRRRRAGAGRRRATRCGTEPVSAAPRSSSDAGSAGATLAVEGLTKRYGRKYAARDVTFSMGGGEVVGLLGPNGAGKTTAFYLIVGFMRPTAGRIYLDGDDITRLPMFRRARAGISYLPQEPSVFRKLTVEQNLLAVLETQRGLPRRNRRRRCDRILHELGLEDLRRQRAYTLSGGERRRTEIARALAMNPKFLLLDEPFAGIDPIAVQDIKSIVGRLAAAGIGVLITDHNVRDTLEITDRSYIIRRGEIMVSGTRGELLENQLARQFYLGRDFRM